MTERRENRHTTVGSPPFAIVGHHTLCCATRSPPPPSLVLSLSLPTMMTLSFPLVPLLSLASALAGSNLCVVVGDAR